MYLWRSLPHAGLKTPMIFSVFQESKNFCFLPSPLLVYIRGNDRRHVKGTFAQLGTIPSTLQVSSCLTPTTVIPQEHWLGRDLDVDLT